MEWFRLEGTFKDQLVQPPFNEQGHLQPDQVAQSSVQPDFECLQGCGVYHFLVNLCPCYTTLIVKTFFLPYIQSKFTLF